MNRREFLAKGGGLVAVSLVGGHFLKEALMPTVRVMGGLNPQRARTFAACVGIRGLYGQLPITQVPGYPQSGLVTISPGTDTIQAAITANGDNTKFQLGAGTFNTTSRIEPKAGQEFWGVPGSLVTKSGGTHTVQFFGLSGRTNVKVMNIAFSGFSGGQSFVESSIAGWESAYCTMDCDDLMVWGINRIPWAHHNKIWDFQQGGVGAYQMGTQFSLPLTVVEDNEIGPNITTAANGNKWAGVDGGIYRNNWVHGIQRTGGNFLRPGFWLDYMNFNLLIESNIIENCEGSAMMFEANNWSDILAAPRTDFANVVRYNICRNNESAALEILGSSRIEAYQNDFHDNLTAAGWAEIMMSMGATEQELPPTGQGRDIYNTFIHHNQITPKANARAVGFNLTSGNEPQPFADYVTNNTKNNRFDYNTYDITDPTNGNVAVWFGVNKTMSQWQAVPAPGQTGQDEHGTAV